MTLAEAKLLAVFSFPWVWAQSPVLARQAVTLPDESDAGLESRDSLLDPLRLRAKFSIQNADGFQDARRIERFMRNNICSQVVVPLWTEAVAVTVDVDGDTISCGSTTNRLFSTDRFALLWHSAASYELIELSAVNAGSVVATEAVAGTFIIGDRLVPVMITESMTAVGAVDWESSYWVKGGMEFSEDPTMAAALPFSFSLPTAGGITVWPLPLSWAGGVRHEHDLLSVTEVADSLVGRSVAMSAPRSALRCIVDFDGREMIARALALHDALGGRRSPLWFPSGKRDLAIVTGGTNVTSIDVQPIGYADNEWAQRQSASDYSRVFVLIRKASTWHTRRITNCTVLQDGNERITISGAVTVDSSAHISFLLYGRMGFDDLAVEFVDAVHASAQVEFKELPTEYATYYNLADANGTINADGVLLP